MKACVGSPGAFTFDLAGNSRAPARSSTCTRVTHDVKVDGLPGRVGTFSVADRGGARRQRLGFPHSAVAELAPDQDLRFLAIRRDRALRCFPLSVERFGVASHRVAKARHGALTICDQGSSYSISG